jgi:hypothetical protein
MGRPTHSHSVLCSRRVMVTSPCTAGPQRYCHRRSAPRVLEPDLPPPPSSPTHPSSSIRAPPPSLSLFSTIRKLHCCHFFHPRSMVKQASSFHCFLSILFAAVGPVLATNLLVQGVAPPDRRSTASAPPSPSPLAPVVSVWGPAAPKWNPRAALPLLARSARRLTANTAVAVGVASARLGWAGKLGQI